MASTDCLGVALVFGVHPEAGVADRWELLEELFLGLLVIVGNDALVVGGQAHHLALFSSREVGVGSGPVLDLLLDDGKERISLVAHGSGTDTVESGLEGGLIDGILLFGVGDGGVHFGNGSGTDASEERFKVIGFEGLDGVQHGGSSAVHVTLESISRVAQEVDESTLLDEVVLVVDAHILHLFLSVDEMGGLDLLNGVSPLVAQLLGLVARVDVVENGELGSEEHGEVTGLNVADIPGEEELVMEDHSTEPFVVGPGTETGDTGDSSEVHEHENQSASGAGEGFVMGGDLLGTDGLEKGAHVVVVGVDERVLLGVVGVHVPFAHRVNFVLVVRFVVRRVDRLASKSQSRHKLETSSIKTRHGFF